MNGMRSASEMNQSIFSLKGRVAIVTGGIGLLGKEHCYALSEFGASVVVCDLNEEACERFAKHLPTSSMGIGANVTDPLSIRRLLNRVLQKYGQIDILINNAALNDKVEDPLFEEEGRRFEHYPLRWWKAMMETNLTSVFLCSQIIGIQMAEQGKGKIINIASTYGMVGPDQSLYQTPEGKQTFYKSAAYSASKGAILAFTRFLAAYWGKAGVRVNCLTPGGVENSQADFFIQNYAMRTPLGRMAKVTDYWGAIIFLASDASDYMTGANLVVDGGWTAW